MKRPIRLFLLLSCALPAMAALTACGGSDGGVSSTPTPPPTPAVAPPPPPPPPPPVSFNTAEYRRSNGAVQSGALTAYTAGASGAGVTVAVIDSGIAVSNAEFAGRIHVASADLAGSRGLQDEGGHGTAVSAVLAAAKDDVGIQGIAFASTILVARTDSPGTCVDTTPVTGGCSHDDNAIARGVDLAVANSARVINISLGGSPANSTLRNAINRATAAGIIIVISAGNEGVTDPVAAVDPDPLAQIANTAVARGLVIIAGALDATNTALRDFSNKAGNGASHYLGALGSRLTTINQNGTLLSYSGTSFSAPVLSGAVALVAQAFPNLTSAQIVDLLFRTATDLGTVGVDTTYGYGALDLAKAFAPQGSMSLAGSTIPLSSTSGQTSSAMGNAGQTGLSTVALDEYGRAYALDISSGIRAAPQSQKLAAALNIGMRSRSVGLGQTQFALSVVPGRDDVAVNRWLLSAHDKEHARAIAGSVISRMGPNTRIALGISTSGNALAQEFEASQSSAFLLGGRATNSLGFDARPDASLAVRHNVAGFTLTASAETGVAELWQPRLGEALRPGYRSAGYGQYALAVERSFGDLTFGARATQLIERETVLGGYFDGLYGKPGAKSWFADLEAHWTPAALWSLNAAYRKGWTRVAAGGLRLNDDLLHSDAWSLDIARNHLFGAGDRFALRLSQPLRLSSGGLDLSLPTSYDYATSSAGYTTSRLTLAPSGREIDAEAVYSRPLAVGLLSGNVYFRRDPGNIASTRGDIGAAIRFTLGL